MTIYYDRYYQFRARVSIASDVVSNGMNVVDPLSRLLAGSSAANALAKWNRVAGWLPLERAQTQNVRLALNVKADPVKVTDLLIDKCARLGAVGEPISRVEQCFELAIQK